MTEERGQEVSEGKIRHLKLLKNGKNDWDEIYIGRLFWLCANHKMREFYIYFPLLDEGVVIPLVLFEIFKQDAEDLHKALGSEALGRCEKLGLAKEIEGSQTILAALIEKERTEKRSEGKK